MQAMGAIYKESQASRRGVERLTPLLSLLEQAEPQQGGPIELIQQALEAVILGQKHLMIMIEDLDKKVDALSKKRT